MPLTRRDFGKGLATTAALPLVAVAANDQKPNDPPKVDPLRIEAAMWLESIRVRYPDPHLTPEIMNLIAGDVIGDILHTRRISAFPLKNSDAPFAATARHRE